MSFFRLFKLTLIAYLVSILIVSPLLADDLQNKVAGDVCYDNAETEFFNFEAEKASADLDKCLSDFDKNPGLLGGAIKAYLLKTQIYLEKGDLVIAEDNAKKAMALNLSATTLDSLYYSPKMQRFYERVVQKYKPKQISNLTVEVSKARGDPIYVNGVLRGHGPSLVVPVVSGETQIISAGMINGSLVRVSTTKDKLVKIASTGQNSKITPGKVAPVKEAKAKRGKISKPLLWGIIGAVVVGAGVGTALALTGSSSGSGNAPVTISGPQPD